MVSIYILKIEEELNGSYVVIASDVKVIVIKSDASVKGQCLKY